MYLIKTNVCDGIRKAPSDKTFVIYTYRLITSRHGAGGREPLPSPITAEVRRRHHLLCCQSCDVFIRVVGKLQSSI